MKMAESPRLPEPCVSPKIPLLGRRFSNSNPKVSLCLDVSNAKQGLSDRLMSPLTEVLSVSPDSSKDQSPLLAVGERFSMDFAQGDILGSGTMSVVKVARRLSDSRLFAVKVVTSEDDELRQFTRDEYELVKTLRHASIIKFEAIYESPMTVMILMMFCAGGSVEDRVVQDGVFEEARVRILSAQLLRGVNYLHGKRVVHRDIKPSNLLLTSPSPRSALKITDFNSAKRIGQSAGSSLMLTDRGTQLYSAPELRFGRMWNERIDIWAAGLCLYFMLHGLLPFDSSKSYVKTQLLAGRLPTIEWASSVSPAMANLIEQCISVDFKNRPPALELLVHPVLTAATLRDDAPRGSSKTASAAVCERTPRTDTTCTTTEDEVAVRCDCANRAAGVNPAKSMVICHVHRIAGLLTVPTRAMSTSWRNDSKAGACADFSEGQRTLSSRSCSLPSPDSGQCSFLTPRSNLLDSMRRSASMYVLSHEETSLPTMSSPNAMQQQAFSNMIRGVSDGGLHWKEPCRYDVLLRLSQNRQALNEKKRAVPE